MNKKVVITGARRGLGLLLAEKFDSSNFEVFTTSRSKPGSSGKLQSGCFDFTQHSDVIQFYEVLKQISPKIIVHSASLYRGCYKGSDFDYIQEWSNFTLAAHAMAHYAVNQHNLIPKVVFIGSIAGVPNKFTQNRSLYCSYKGLLRHIAESAYVEGADVSYINLGSFRDDGDGIQALTTFDVLDTIFQLCLADKTSQVQVDLMPKSEINSHGTS